MPTPLIPEADLRRELRNMVAMQIRELHKTLGKNIADMKTKLGQVRQGSNPRISSQASAQMERKLIEAIDRMEAKKAEIDGAFEHFFAFIDNAQFPDSSV